MMRNKARYNLAFYAAILENTVFKPVASNKNIFSAHKNLPKPYILIVTILILFR